MTRPGRPCRDAKCMNLQPCPHHPSGPFATAQRSAPALYETPRWKAMRAHQLIVEPDCAECEVRDGKLVKATHVDHVIPHRGSEALFFDESNLQSLCARHHNEKTGRETRQRVTRGALSSAVTTR